ncbi:helix-turn-helix transcriptional regulator [Rhodococcus aetherivorans]|uniref:helix-turn-helix transcriptional regulator n=1 Tax=Rhodococcus aetherivorans TaxID=191292 RepID=UPI00294A116B|nr:DNA-binding protein [Rhodococcus aetherivorans]MDV6293300.1 DNA-binding protein [Rhodococcus aetherivorans]
MSQDSILGTPQQVAQAIHTTTEALAQRRYLGTGPKFVKLGRRVFYKWADVYAWIDQNTMQRTDDRPGAA